ncbi:hypothetical protein E8E11_002104 [Didymella keratinophila]|nr:hypothetical protein E8E11_002104 [Didymella keratinophila]
MPLLVEPLDLDVAQKHAIAAASAAFTRSRAQEALERKANRSIELGRSKSTTNRKSLTSQGSHFPPRELGVSSVPVQKNVQTSSPHRLSAASATEKFPLLDPAPLSDRPTPVTRPLSAQPSITFSDARPVSQPRSHRQSTASSVTSQQIRKARSMYYASSVQTGSPIARPPAKYLTTPPPVGVSPASTIAPTAYVPTRSTGPSPLTEPRVTVPAVLNDTIDTARDKVLQDFQQQPRSIKHKPSLFLAPFKKRQDKTKDKAKRLSSTYPTLPSNTYTFADDTTADITVSDFMPQVEVKDKRSFSGSLKKKIKRVFKRTSAKTPSLPVQQIEASRESATLTQDVSVVTTTPTATQIEMRIAKTKDRWQTPLNDSLTPQFPRETDRLSTMTNPPQQRPTDPVAAATGQSSAPASPSVQLSKSMQTPLSPSVYSRNTDGVSIPPNDSVMSFNSHYDSDRTHQGGSAVILTSQSVRSYVIGTPSPKRPDSTRSSRDWKAWLSHEVSGIEAASQEDITILQQYATPSGKHKRVTTQTIRTSQTDSDDTTVIVRESLETLTPRAVPGNSAALGTDAQVPQPFNSDNEPRLPGSVPENSCTIVDGSKNSSSDRSPLGDRLPSAPQSTPIAYKERSSSTPSKSSTSTQLPLGMPTSARMNERFPFLITGRCSSSNNSSRSHLSKSPTSSVGSSSKTTKTPSEPQTVYSTEFLPAPTSGCANVHGSVVRTTRSTWESKENITPPTNAGVRRPNISPLGVGERLKSLQPLSLAALNQNLNNVAPPSSRMANASPSKRAASPVETVVARPSLRVTIRPRSPEKLSRRPRSAFDLRHTPSPRPASELRRPALQHEVAKDQSTPDMKTQGDGLPDVDLREGSVTPGQRMAECFLKERKSGTVLERGIRKSTGKFVREDTPAFL